MSLPIRLRFAPSPTGNLHVGNFQTAVVNYFIALKLGGSCFIRVDDTDKKRNKEGALDSIFEDLKWAGFKIDEVNYQSKRVELYEKAANRLKEKGLLYRCFCSSEELAAERELQLKTGNPPKYSGKWAKASEESVKQELDKGTPHTWRLKIPQDRGGIEWVDLVRGKQKVEASTLGDFIVLREDGSATYNFASAFDDVSLNATHIVRGDDHSSNTPKQILLIEALAQIEEYKEEFSQALSKMHFGHIPIVLGLDKSKLSKRNGSRTVKEYIEMGVLPEALVNAMLPLFWTPPPKKEIFSKLSQACEYFETNKINKSPAVFDEKKLFWINSKHLKSITDEKQRLSLAKKWLPKEGANVQALNCVWDELTLLSEVEEKINSIIKTPTYESPDEKSKESAKLWLSSYTQPYEQWLSKVKETAQFKGKELFMPLRIALSGQKHGPELKDIINILGEETVKSRLENYLAS